ncbi:MAG: 30S ribosome-binding factor RbfA [Planctomycetota bacterium]|jgi:ribosome-binding factor A
MSSRRVARLAEAVRETVSTAVLFNLRDPRIKNVTVLRAEVTSDLRSAKVYVSVLGSDRDRALCLQGLDSSRGYLQSKIADRIQTRYTPILKFILDDKATDQVSEAARILDELASERRSANDVYGHRETDEEAANALHRSSNAEAGANAANAAEPETDSEVAESED